MAWPAAITRTVDDRIWCSSGRKYKVPAITKFVYYVGPTHSLAITCISQQHSHKYVDGGQTPQAPRSLDQVQFGVVDHSLTQGRREISSPTEKFIYCRATIFDSSQGRFCFC